MARLSTPNQAILFFTMAVLVATTLIRSAHHGHVKLMHFMTKYLGIERSDSGKKEEDDNAGSATLPDWHTRALFEEEVDMGLPKETDWSSYSHSNVDPLKKTFVEEKLSWIGDMVVDGRTFLFEKIKSKGKRYRASSRFGFAHFGVGVRQNSRFDWCVLFDDEFHHTVVSANLLFKLFSFDTVQETPKRTPSSRRPAPISKSNSTNSTTILST